MAMPCLERQGITDLVPASNKQAGWVNQVRQVRPPEDMFHQSDLSAANRMDPDTGDPVPLYPSQRVIAMGASSGGAEALTQVLTELPPQTPGILIALHLPYAYVNSFCRRLRHACNMAVAQAENGDRVVDGRILVVAQEQDMTLRSDDRGYFVQVEPGPDEDRHRHPIDTLFHSVAQQARENAIGVILTGVGRDGAEGLLTIRHKGGRTIAQDYRTSAVFGMPKSAIHLGGVETIASLEDISRVLQQLVNRQIEPEVN